MGILCSTSDGRTQIVGHVQFQELGSHLHTLAGLARHIDMEVRNAKEQRAKIHKINGSGGAFI